MPPSRFVLDRRVSVAVLAEARTEAQHHEDLGCSIQGPTARRVRRALAPLKRRIARLGRDGALAHARALIEALDASPAYRALCDGALTRAGRPVLREEVLYPGAERLRPRILHLRREGLGFDVPVTAREWPQVCDALSALSLGATSAELRRHQGIAAELVSELSAARWLTRAPEPVKPSRPGALFVGHNTIVFSGRKARVAVDPWFRPASEFDLPQYQPMQPADLGPLDAVVITHTHGDHFHLGSLARLPRSTRIFVPAVERESLFSTDCAVRLRQLGFTHVERLAWGERRVVGDVTVEAWPFHGEQPTSGRGVHRGLFNEGNTWVLRTAGLSAAFFADSGRDTRGDMKDVCARIHREGPVDVLFSGIRGFRLAPIFYGFTTLEAFLVDVPLGALTTPQQLMASPEEALDYGERLGARFVVPCADGGAPWYWREGMGPRYPGYPGEPVPGASTDAENPDADPYPERLQEVRRARGHGPKALVLRPGEGLSLRPGGAARRQAFDGFRWPFAPAVV